MTEANKPIDPVDPDQVRAEASALAEHLRRSGVHWLPKPQPESVARLEELFLRSQEKLEPSPTVEQAAATARPKLATSQSVAPRSIRPTARLDPVAPSTHLGGKYPQPDLPHPERQTLLDELNAKVSVCTLCEVLASCRTNTVFGEGNASPRVVFFGEGPGADEDRSGRPFVGRAGQLLTKMIEACSFRREDVYILNTVKCRPPGNRNPEADEIANCREYYESQLSILRPEYIVCLGAVSAQELLKSKLSVGRLRGKLHSYFESKVLVTYHPAYLLRNPAAKKAAWDDLCLMLRDAGIKE